MRDHFVQFSVSRSFRDILYRIRESTDTIKPDNGRKHASDVGKVRSSANISIHYGREVYTASFWCFGLALCICLYHCGGPETRDGLVLSNRWLAPTGAPELSVCKTLLTPAHPCVYPRRNPAGRASRNGCPHRMVTDCTSCLLFLKLRPGRVLIKMLLFVVPIGGRGWSTGQIATKQQGLGQDTHWALGRGTSICCRSGRVASWFAGRPTNETLTRRARLLGLLFIVPQFFVCWRPWPVPLGWIGRTDIYSCDNRKDRTADRNSNLWFN